MSTFSLTTRLPSCKVTRQSLEELEDYVTKAVSDISESVKEGTRQSYRYEVTVKDSSGTETLATVREFDRSSFPNDTEAIELDCAFEGKTRLSVGVKFNYTKLFSKLYVSYTGTSSREVVSGLSKELLHRLEPYKNNHAVFHSGFFYVALVLLSSSSLGFLVNSIYRHNSHTALLYAAGLLITVMCVILKFLKPYTQFDTPRNEKYEKRINWILLALIGFFLFTVLGVYFRQRIFGF